MMIFLLINNMKYYVPQDKVDDICKLLSDIVNAKRKRGEIANPLLNHLGIYARNGQNVESTTLTT